MAADAWNGLENIDAKHLAHPRVLKARLEVALSQWEMVVELARHLSKVEPNKSLHVFNLAQTMRELEGHLKDLGRVDDAERMLAVATEQYPQLDEVAIDHPGPEAVW